MKTFTFSLLSLIALSLPMSSIFAQEVVKKVIITPAPKAVCATVDGHWEGNVWVDAHNVCRYENRTEGAAWISDYWSCTEATDDGTCTAWQMVPGHWVKTIE